MRNRIVMSVLLAVAAACGGSASSTHGSARIGAAGGSIKTDNVRLDVPAGALQSDTDITIHEATPPSGVVRRITISPQGLALGATARINVKDDGSTTPVKLVGTTSQGSHQLGRCCHDDSAHQHSGDLAQLVTVDLVHATACASPCPDGQYCEDGVCVARDAFCGYCGPACGSSGCDGWMCGCNDGMCGCHVDDGTCCNGTTCCSGSMCCMGGMCGGHH